MNAYQKGIQNKHKGTAKRPKGRITKRRVRYDLSEAESLATQGVVND